MNTANIKKFLQTAYTDENLAALLAHAQDEKLSFFSCCCLIGVTNAPHALRGYVPEFAHGRTLPAGSTHHQSVRLNSELAADAEEEFFFLGNSDAERRERMIPLIEAEITRRELARALLEVQPGGDCGPRIERRSDVRTPTSRMAKEASPGSFDFGLAPFGRSACAQDDRVNGIQGA